MTDPRAEEQAPRAQAVAAFLSWAPARGCPRTRRLGLELRAAAVALALGLVMSVCSMLAPIAGAAGVGGTWGAGSHVLLFCHLVL